MSDDFYIGWKDKAPAPHAHTTWRVVLGLLAGTLFLSVALAASQRLIGVAFFEWGEVKEFSGVLRADPYPHLMLQRPTDAMFHTLQSADELTSGMVAAPLVAPFKFGVKREDIRVFDGKPVTLRATRIYRDGHLLLELAPNSVKLAPSGVAFAAAATKRVSLGYQTFRGEIVDSKCWMGVMNPGVLTPHRACAVRCISGGVPPMLLVRREGAPPLNLLLVSPEDKPVNDQVLDFVAEPVEITGEVVRQGELLTLRADPATFRRLEHGR
jgi:hypothetical protein